MQASATRGRRSNVQPRQTSRMNLLFVCARNRLRSPTAERIFADWPGVDTASAGTAADAEAPVTPELLDWADVIMVMEPVPA